MHFNFFSLKQMAIYLLSMGFWFQTSAQTEGHKSRLPLTVTVFTESVSLPNFRGFFKSPNWGLRIGTEFYYRQSDHRQLLQTVNLGYYNHDGLHQGLFVSSEFGYRKFIGGFFADATVGAGYLHIVSDLKRYEPSGDGFRLASQRMQKVMPTVGLGMGYRFGQMTVFSRYEIFGEMPFNNGGSPVLPHQSLHLGTRFQPFKN